MMTRTIIKRYLLGGVFILLTLSACVSVSVVRMTSTKMNKLELGMTKNQVTSILGDGYTIAEKRMENGKHIEVLSYRDFYNDDEFYLFLFNNNKLEKWHRETLSRHDTIKQ